MYKELSKQDIIQTMNFTDNYKVDALLVVGTHPKNKEYIHLYEAIDKLGVTYIEEKIEDKFFEDIKSFVINGKRIWFDVVYGSAYLTEVIHFASMLGSKANILLGTCGALKSDLKYGDIIVPYASYGNESSTRMYQRENDINLHESNKELCSRIKKEILQREIIDEGKLMTVQAMFAETKEDVELWSRQGYSGIDMESSTMFAVSNHFNVPSAALLFFSDNLVNNQLVTDKSFEEIKAKKIFVRKENYQVALKVLIDIIQE